MNRPVSRAPNLDELRAVAWGEILYGPRPEDVQIGLRLLAALDGAERRDVRAMHIVAWYLSNTIIGTGERGRVVLRRREPVAWS